MATLRKAVFVRDPDQHRTVLLLAGEEPEPRLAALVTNPDAWEDGQLPDLDTDTADSGKDSSDSSSGGDDKDKETAPAKKTAAKKTAARKPVPGPETAAGGGSGA